MNKQEETRLNREASQNLLERFTGSVLALIIANLIPLFGAIFLGWSVSLILILYWSENLVVGLFNVMKMRLAEGEIEPNKCTLNGRPVTANDRGAMIKFFILHYGMFTLCHGVVVVAFFGAKYGGSLSGIGVGWLILLGSHAISYKQNFIGKEEYKRLSFVDLFVQPYKRIVVMHITIIGGGALVEKMGSPVYALALMIVMKTVIDILSHLLEHKKFTR